MVKTAILVSGGGTALQSIMDAHLFGDIHNCELTAIISSSPDAYAVSRANFANRPVFVVDRSIFPNNHTFSEAVLKKLIDLDIQLAVLAGFDQILEPNFYDDFRGRVMNVYPALLPAFYTGEVATRYVQEETLRFGCKVTGATVYFSEGNSAPGPVIMQKTIEIKPDDTPEILQKRIFEECEISMLPKAINLYCSGLLKIEGRQITILDPTSE